MILECGCAGAALAGDHSGDQHVVAPFEGGALVAVIDGLGHGPEAALAARTAATVLSRRAGQPLRVLLDTCHEALRRTRGAVMSLASFDARAGTMSWSGVGNVEALLLRAGGAGREALTLRGGVVGYQLPSPREGTLPVAPGDTLVMATDGIKSGFVVGLELAGTPQEVADRIFGQHARGSDDALVVVARYRGTAP